MSMFTTQPTTVESPANHIFAYGESRMCESCVIHESNSLNVSINDTYYLGRSQGWLRTEIVQQKRSGKCRWCRNYGVQFMLLVWEEQE